MGGYLALVMWITGGWIVSGIAFALIFGRVCQRTMQPWD